MRRQLIAQVAWAGLPSLGQLLAQLAQLLQQRVDALRSAIVFGLEPVFAALTAWILLDERMGLVALSGAALVVLALIWSQWQPAPALTQP